MLRTLELRDFAIVDSLHLDLAPGFNVLTGETGAGKSILVDALSLLTGVRADTAMIRAGSEDALVQGIFEEMTVGTVSRRLQRSGRHHARVDGELVSVAELADRGGEMIGIFAQHAALELSSAAHQREQLDLLLDEEEQRLLAGYREEHAQSLRVGAELHALLEAELERLRRIELLEFQIDEIRTVAPVPGEDTALKAELEGLRHAERILGGVGRAFELLSEQEQSATELAMAALRELRSVAPHLPSLGTLEEELGQAVDGLQAVASELESFLVDFQADPARPEEVQAPLARLDALGLKYGDGPDAILAYQLTAKEDRDRLKGAEARLGALQHEVTILHQRLAERADSLGHARRRAATALTERVVPLLGELGMSRARFEVRVEPTSELGPHGRDAVRFMLGANPGEPLGPLADIGSGGELSRIMLALHVVTGSTLPVLVFDEVDAGIGGSAARAVGSMLRRLSRNHQVLVVTHLPQVAAYADVQYAVSKQESGGRTITRVDRLGPEPRRAELARMLSGSVTELSLEHAAELLRDALKPAT